MSNIAVIGSSWGDEAKGRITHDFSPNYDWVIRFNGGANAGHTIYRDGEKYVHHLVPSFDWRSHNTKAFLSSGMVIDLEELCNEVKQLYKIDPNICKRIYVDPDTFIVLPLHKNKDKENVDRIGSTGRGIGPAYEDKIARKGLRIRDFPLDNEWMDGAEQIKFINDLEFMGVNFKSLYELRDEFEKSNLLFEGSQGVMLDINVGTYPFVSCSQATVGGIYAAGFHFVKLDKVYGVAKCYTTVVGNPPFPTEIFGEEADWLREKGKEYGATTGRPRRVGWCDLVALDYACKVGGITNLIITKFDILNGLKEVPMCVNYNKKITGGSDFFRARPTYIKVPGWENCKNVQELKPFLDKVVEYTKIPVDYVSCGVNTEDLIKL